METIYFLVVSAAIGYVIHMAQKIDERLDVIERELLRMKLSLPKRKND